MDSESAVKSSSPHPMLNIAKKHSIPQENANDDDAAEISIFEAHKYFNEESNPLPSHNLHSLQTLPSSLSPLDNNYATNFNTKSFRTTPPPSSEASWNSRMALLSSTGDRARKRWSAAKKWFLRRNCCCSGEKSVLVKEEGGPIVLIDAESLPISDNVVEIHHIKAMAPISANSSSSIDRPCQQRITAKGRPFIDGAVGFTFPILNPSSDDSNNNNIIPLEKMFLEALQPPPPLVRRPSSMGSPVGREDDGASDASSDLFEIESFSTLAAGPMHRWDSLDEVFSSERKSAASECKVGGATAPNGCGEGKAVGNGSVLMRCREEKNAMAAAAVVKCMGEGPPVIPLHVGSSPPRRSSHAPPLTVA